jgi:hypothetical protein
MAEALVFQAIHSARLRDRHGAVAKPRRARVADRVAALAKLRRFYP